MVSTIVAGRVIAGIAVATLVVTLLGTIVAQQQVRDFHLGVAQSLELTADVLDTVDESFVVAEDALAIIGEGVTEAESGVRSLGGSMEEGQAALDSVSALAGVEIADAIADIEQGLPAMEQAATAIDDTLGTLSLLPFGLTYDPERPLGETIGDIADGLEGLPDELRDQADQVQRTSAELADATRSTIATADSLAALDERIDAAAELIGGYDERTTEATLLVDRQRDALDTTATQARFLIIAFGLFFALGQFGPIYLGLALAGGKLDIHDGGEAISRSPADPGTT
jgi:methyl-accepting chemotaxis protein